MSHCRDGEHDNRGLKEVSRHPEGFVCPVSIENDEIQRAGGQRILGVSSAAKAHHGNFQAPRSISFKYTESRERALPYFLFCTVTGKGEKIPMTDSFGVLNYDVNFGTMETFTVTQTCNVLTAQS